MNIEQFATLSPMKYYNNEDETNQKRIDMIENKDSQYVATRKMDGDWSMCIHYTKGHNLIRSRSISVKTGTYGDYTEKLPHLVAEMDTWPDNTVVLAELCFPQPNSTANEVGTILRCLPAKAIERQKTKPLYGLVFDFLMVDGEDISVYSYIKRLEAACESFKPDGIFNQCKFFRPTEVYYNNFAEAADRIISSGGEGLVIQKKNNSYMPGTRTAWATLKLKKKMDEMELKVVDTVEPNKFYEGQEISSWEYFVDGVAVTKPYYMGWKNGVVVDFNGVQVKVTSGLTDADREWLASKEADEKIQSGELYAVVKAMCVNSQNSLRHPYLVRLREASDGAADEGEKTNG